jgi:hypothetical protein
MPLPTELLPWIIEKAQTLRAYGRAPTYLVLGFGAWHQLYAEVQPLLTFPASSRTAFVLYGPIILALDVPLDFMTFGTDPGETFATQGVTP